MTVVKSFNDGSFTIRSRVFRRRIGSRCTSTCRNLVRQDNQISQKSVCKLPRGNNIRSLDTVTVGTVVANNPDLVSPICHLLRYNVSEGKRAYLMDQIAGQLAVFNGNGALNHSAICNGGRLLHILKVKHSFGLGEGSGQVLRKTGQSLARARRRHKLMPQLECSDVGITALCIRKKCRSGAGISAPYTADFRSDRLLTTITSQGGNHSRPSEPRTKAPLNSVNSNHTKRLISHPAMRADVNKVGRHA